MVKIKFTPVAIGIIIEKLFVDRALKNANAERIIRIKAAIKVTFRTSLNHSPKVSRLLPFNCHLIRAAPETFRAA